MIVTAFYNKKEKTLLLTSGGKETTKIEPKISFENEKNVTKIFNEEKELTNINIFDHENEELNTGIVTHKKIEKILKENFGEKIEIPFVVGKILKIEKHPKSEKLNICEVSLGEEKVQIVCGAKNVTEGIKVIVAKVGAMMPSGNQIVKSKVIDIVSQGMICSFKEVGLEQTEEGIAILPDSFEEGKGYFENMED